MLADPARIDEEFRKAWLPYFLSFWAKGCLEEFDHEVEGWLPLLPEVSLPRLTGQMVADVVEREGATAGSLDGWVWRAFLPRLRILGFGLMGCWMLKMR